MSGFKKRVRRRPVQVGGELGAGSQHSRRGPQSRVAVAAAAVIALVVSLFMAPPASAAPAEQPISSYAVAFTGGIGVFLRSAPNADDSSRVLAAPEGAMIPVECETIGVPRTNSYGQTSDVYARSPGGLFTPTIYLDNGVLGRSGAPDCGALDAARAAATQPTTVGNLLRAGQAVVYTQDGPDRIRAYYSLSATDAIASRYSDESDDMDLLINIECTTVGVMISVATSGVGGIVLGAAGGFTCGSALQNDLAPIAGIVRSADKYNKCVELRMHREGDQWVTDLDGWTMTDSPDYCG